MIELDYCHKCRKPPFEAAIYSLEAEGEVLEKFRADVNAELTVKLDESERTERSTVALRVDFSKEDVARVSLTSLLLSQTLISSLDFFPILDLYLAELD